MERHIKLYVKNELFRGLKKPSPFNRRYNPTRRDITNHMYQATVRLRFSKIDQNNLACKIEEWKKEYPQDKFFFRGYGEIVDEEPPDNSEDEIKVKQTGSTQKLLFVHQTAFHRQLLKRYGNHICLLDATYRTTKYSIPLFFVVVKTNVDYQVVGSFAIQDETTHSIGEAWKF